MRFTTAAKCSLAREREEERQWIKRYRTYAGLVTDPTLQSACERLAQRHQKQLDRLKSHVQ